MPIDIDVNRFLEETTLPGTTVLEMKTYRDLLKQRKDIFSWNDILGKTILSNVFGDLPSAHFHRWIHENYEIGDED